VVLGQSILPAAQRKVTIGPKGLALRDFFSGQTREMYTISSAAATGDPVLIMVFSHGDFDRQGGLLLGIVDAEDLDTFTYAKF
jgi:hypothetical protein